MGRSLESLEKRTLLAAINWTGNGDGVNWDHGSNWSGGAVPTINDDVTINVAANPTVTIRTNAAVRSLNSAETIYLSYPGNFISFKVATTATISKDILVENVMDGGTWGGTGRIHVMNNAALHINPRTINCDVVMDGDSVWSVEGSLEFNGTMYLGQAGTPRTNLLYMSGPNSVTLSGTGTIVFAGDQAIFTSAINNNLTVFGNNTLTIGPGIHFDVQSSGRIQNNYVTCKTIFQGTLTVSGAGRRFIVNNTFENQGTMRASNGGFLGMVLDSNSTIGNLELEPGGLATIQAADVFNPDDRYFNVNAPLTVPAGATLALSGRFNLNAPIDVSGDLIWEYSGASPIAQAEAEILGGYNGGAWNGSEGFRSTRAATTPLTALGFAESSDILGPSGGAFGGMQVDGTAILIRCTRVGDANLDGVVNFDDYSRIDLGFNTGRTGWSNGDFNYDGIVNFDDYSLIDLSFNTPGTLGARTLRR